ncbi:MAG: substrate-binding domain-containing protein [Lachnospiraceae bacterium]|nr:substrate-binding domain-containing protein [Lachnospiraceae bacterium]MCI9306275.1 substrate-binding domain-containing protein [Lachnospiraceae bacterium]
MKKFISMLLVLTMIFSVTACGKSGGGKLDIGIVLPTKDEDRWLADEAKFLELIEEKGYKAEIMYSQASSATEKANVEALIAKGIKVLIICPFDVAAAASTVEMAKEEGVQVISYDRLITGTEAIDYYVAFESVKIGEAMGQYLVDQAAAYGGSGLNLYLYSGALTDNNSFSYFRGYWNSLQPKLADGTFVVRNSDVAMKYKDTLDLTHEQLYEIMQSVDTEWEPAHAKTLAEADLTNASKEEKALSFIIAPDDNTGRAIGDAFLADSDVEEYRLCGADGVEGSVQYIIDGKQDMTVYCNPEMITASAMELAEKLVNGEKAETSEVIDNEAKEVSVLRSDVQTITRDNIVEVFLDGGVYDAKNYTNYEGISDSVKP